MTPRLFLSCCLMALLAAPRSGSAWSPASAGGVRWRATAAAAAGIRRVRMPAIGGPAADHMQLPESRRTCQFCKQQYLPSENTAGNSCVYHPGLFTGRLNRINDVDCSDLEFFWSCCGEYDKAHPGCFKGRHAGYGEELDGWRSPLTGKQRS
jgi:hypothetical protein